MLFQLSPTAGDDADDGATADDPEAADDADDGAMADDADDDDSDSGDIILAGADNVFTGMHRVAHMHTHTYCTCTCPHASLHVCLHGF